MTTQKAIGKAIAVFAKASKGDVRTVALMEGSGSGDEWSQVVIRIGYAVDGDYTESDKNPFDVNVKENADGKITAERVEF